MTLHALDVQVQLREQQLGDSSLHLLVAALVEGLRVNQQVESKGEELAACVKGAGGVGQLSFDCTPLLSECGQLGLDLVAWPVWVVEQFKVAIFLGVKLL